MSRKANTPRSRKNKGAKFQKEISLDFQNFFKELIENYIKEKEQIQNKLENILNSYEIDRKTKEFLIKDISNLFEDKTLKQLINVKDKLNEEIKTAIMGESGSDIKFGLISKEFFNFDVEAKKQERLSIWEYIKQVNERVKENQIPIIIFSRNYEKNKYMIIKLKDFFNIIKKIYFKKF